MSELFCPNYKTQPIEINNKKLLHLDEKKIAQLCFKKFYRLFVTGEKSIYKNTRWTKRGKNGLIWIWKKITKFELLKEIELAIKEEEIIDFKLTQTSLQNIYMKLKVLLKDKKFVDKIKENN